MVEAQTAPRKKLSSAERSRIAKEGWARRMEREKEKAAVTEGENRSVVAEGPEDEDVLVLHFLTDGFTAMSKTWYRGEELSVRRGSAEWKSTLDRDGNTWLDMDEEKQVERYGVVHFRVGHWTGKKVLMTQEQYEKALSENDQAAIKRYEKQQARSAPAPGISTGR